jgi:hypothetical protein
MPYVLQELLEIGEKRTLGEPVHDIIVAKVIASRRAVRTQLITVVVDTATGAEVARYDPSVTTPKQSVRRMRVDALPEKSEFESGVSQKKKSG